MSVIDRLAALVSAASPDSMVPVRWLAELISRENPQLTGETAPNRVDFTPDLTVVEVAAAYSRSPSTIRGWIAAGRLEGAYQLADKEWRIPRSALDAMQRAQAEKIAKRVSMSVGGTTRKKPADWGEWRTHFRAS